MTELHAEDVAFYSQITNLILQILGWAALFIGVLVAYLILFHSSFFSKRYRALVLYQQTILTVAMSLEGSAMIMCLLSRHQVIVGPNTRWSLNTATKTIITIITNAIFSTNPLSLYFGTQHNAPAANPVPLPNDLSSLLRTQKTHFFAAEQLLPVFISMSVTLLTAFPATAFLMAHSMWSLRKHISKMSKRTRQIQRRNVMILGYQFATMATCISIPFTGIAVLMTSKIPLSSLGNSILNAILVVIFPLHPITSSICMVLLSPRYLRVFKRFFRGEAISDTSTYNHSTM